MKKERCTTPFSLEKLVALNRVKNLGMVDNIYLMFPITQDQFYLVVEDKRNGDFAKYNYEGLNYTIDDVVLIGDTKELSSADFNKVFKEKQLYIPLNFNLKDRTYDIGIDGNNRIMLLEEAIDPIKYYKFKLAILGNPEYACIVVKRYKDYVNSEYYINNVKPRLNENYNNPVANSK